MTFWADGLTLHEARSKQIRNGIRVICPCETMVDDPGPHIQECPFFDMSWAPADEDNVFPIDTSYFKGGEVSLCGIVIPLSKASFKPRRKRDEPSF